MHSRGAAGAPAGTPLSLSIKEAVVSSLANNRSLEVERFSPEITRTDELAAEASFDTTLDGELSGSASRSPTGTDTALENSDTEQLTLGASRLFATGTTLGVGLETSLSGSADSASTRLGVSLTQALLQGRGSAVNLAAVRQARLDTAISRSELQGFAESLVAEVELACWDYLLAIRRIAIVERSLGIAEAQFRRFGNAFPWAVWLKSSRRPPRPRSRCAARR